MNPLVRMEHITKKFPGVIALADVSFDLLPGEVHVILGENGAGKSTLMKIMSGVYKPNDGKLIIKGSEYRELTPSKAKELGISIIYQELSVINSLSIMENLFVARMPKKKVLGVEIIDKKTAADMTKQLLKKINLNHVPDVLVRNLSISDKQLVEIAKSIAMNADVIVMDEPTSSLSEQETQELFSLIRQLKSDGKGIVYISHKLEEIPQIGDRVTVLKDGATVGTKNVSEVTIDELISMMVGRQLSSKYFGHKQSNVFTETIFETKNITRKDGVVRDVSFELKKGEILGFSGLIGAGRSELMCAIYGISPIKTGEIWLHGKKLHIRNPYDALKEGIGLVSENRRETGFFRNFDIKKNIVIAQQLLNSSAGGIAGWINETNDSAIAENARAELTVKCASIYQNITELSGGNQQKVIFAKWLSTNAKLIIFDEPTKGIDVATKAEIYKIMQDLANRGIGVIVVSSEMPELFSICDRILVMSNGKITGEFSVEEATEEKIMKASIL